MSRSGLEAVFFDNRGKLLRFLQARGGGDLAEDLLQELWIKAAAGASGPISDPLSYLYRCANNLMLDRRRSELRARRRDTAWSEDVDDALHSPSDTASGERILIARDDLAAAERTLAELGERTDFIFRRFRLDGVSQRQIADELGISLSAVEKHLQKAYRALLALKDRMNAG